LACLLACTTLLSFEVDACRSEPALRVPPLAELARSADLIAVVHVSGIKPMSAEEAAFTERTYANPPLNVEIRFPSPSAEFSVIRTLKGSIPADSPLRSGADSCEVMLLEGRRYLIFARAPDRQGAEIVPLHGTFTIDPSQYSLNALAEVEHSLNSSNPTPP
jgi:hypothetical protein